MIKLIYEAESVKVCHTLEGHPTWSEVLENVKHFLLGVGYVFDPTADVTLVSEDDEQHYSSLLEDITETQADQVEQLEDALAHVQLALGIKLAEEASTQERLEKTVRHAEDLRREMDDQLNLIDELQCEIANLRRREEDRYEWAD